MFVTSAPPNCGGPGMPHRIISSWRSPSAMRTIGTGMSGDTRKRRQVVREVVRCDEKLAHRVLATGDAVEVAHGAILSCMRLA